MKRLLVAVCALLAFNSASACSCLPIEDAGFIHAKLKRLPANARGALFQLPYGFTTRLDAAAFTIVSDRQPKPLKAQISWPGFGMAPPYFPRPRMLARVGPVGGFEPGARYTITYRGKSHDWRYPVRTEFTIDETALDVGTYRIELAAAPSRRLLQQVDDGGMCASNQATIVAEFDYRIPDHYAPYRSAMIFASETRSRDGKSNLIDYSPSLCERWTLDAVASRAGHDLAQASCEQPGAPVVVRGHAGLLEVEDRLQPTNDLHVDFRQATGSACTGTGMLEEAIAANDHPRIAGLACAIGNEEWRGDTPQGAPPPVAALLELTRGPDAPPRQCVYSASLRWMGDFQLSPTLLGPYLRDDLRSQDDSRIALAAEYFSYAMRKDYPSATRGSDTQAERAALLLAILPEVVQVIVDGSTEPAITFASNIAPARPHIAPYLPALLDAGSRRSATAIAALQALAQLIPDDPRLHALLLQAANEPALMETAVLVYDKVAPAEQQARAVALLVAAAGHGNHAAISALSARKQSAAAAVPVLAALVRDGSTAQLRTDAFIALVNVSNGEPQASAAFLYALEHENLPPYLLWHLSKLGDNAGPLLPAFERMLSPPKGAARRLLDEDQRRAVAKLIEALRTP